jgi:hypothetical protein
MHIGFTNFGAGFENYTGPGVVAYNVITNNFETHIPGLGAALEIENVTGPLVVAHNTIKFNGDRGQPLNPGLMIISPVASTILISDNDLDGTANDQTVGIQIFSDVPTTNQIQINSSNTFGTTPTPTQFLTPPSGAPMSVFDPVIQKALPYLPGGLSISN